MSFDIAIVGGSVAGLSAAREISQKCDANIVIIEEHGEIGRPASSSAFTFVDTIKQYELQKAVVQYYTRIGFYSFLGSKAIFDLNGRKLAILNYTKACQELLRKSKRGNIEIFSDTKAIGIERKNGEMSVDLTGRNEEPIKCDLLVDASGASFFSARFVPFRIPSFYSQPYGFELENCGIPESFLDQISFFVGRPIGSGGGWFYPITKAACRFGVAEITRTPTFPISKLMKYYDLARRNMQPFSWMIKNARLRTKEAGTIPAEPMKHLVSDNVMRVGDSAGHATPHMLEGLRPAIEFGTLCGNIAAEAYEKRDFTKRFLQKYERVWRNQNKLSYLYLLSSAEIFFSYNDREIEKTINFEAKRKVDPELYLKGLKGQHAFPYALVAFKPDLENLRTFIRFVYHNLRWFLE